MGLFNDTINENKNLKLITLEGLDSCGKSSQVKFIKEYYESLGKKVKFIHFPMYGYSVFSDIIAKFLQGEFGTVDEVDPKFVANIYAMDQYLYKNQLIKDLEENDVVIMDRYAFSNLAFQGAKILDKEKSEDLINWIHEFEFKFLELPYPDLILYLDVPINTIEQRLNQERVGDDRNYLNGKKDIHEADINFQSRVRNIYLSLENVLNYFIIKTYNEKEILSPIDLFNTYKYLLK